jgi:DNA polymerase-4
MPPNRSILHVDMDAFFASVEQRDHPEYQGRPVVVGADPKGGRGRGVVAACSYEARFFGIHSALPIGRAWRLCPQAVYLRPRGARYAEVSGEVFGILHRYSDLVEPLSIDEAFLDVTGSRRLLGSAEAIGRKIKAEIRAELGLVASVGVAPNKFVAKIASDIEKPDGLVAVAADRVQGFLDPLPITRLWGVGPKTAERLRSLGMQTIGDLSHRRREDLRASLGEAGEELWLLARGVDERPVVPEGEAKSLGAETTFAEDTSDPGRIRRTLLNLCERVGSRLRRSGRVAGGLTLKFRDEDFATSTRALPLSPPTDLTEDIYRAALALLEKTGWRGKRVRLLGVAAGRLQPRAEGAGAQLALFGDEGAGKRRRVAAVVDTLRERFGSEAVTRAALLEGEGEEEEKG